MTKVLKVIKPFFVMEVGDTFELSQDGSKYVSAYEEYSDLGNDDNRNACAHYESNYSISTEYAKILTEAGYLSEVKDTKASDFVNIFDEIDNMLDTYNEDLNTIADDMKDEPTIMALEKETVLRNMIKVLEHLKSLKK